MKCYICKRNALIEEQKNRAICNECFCRIIEKRVRRYTRTNNIFLPNKRILVVGEVNKCLAKSIVGKMPIKLFFSKAIDPEFIKKNKIDAALIEWTIDDEANLFLAKLFKGEQIKDIDKKHVKMLISLTNEEAALFAKIKGIKFKAEKRDLLIKKIIDNVQKEHPGAKHTLIKNIFLLNKLTYKL